MSLSTKYDPSETEDKWYAHWLKNKYFNAVPEEGKESYTIVIPPPNVTGVLHMGHMLNNTIQDVLIRKARMEGKVACWVPGTDHASIATEAKVVRMLREQGITKSNISRDQFMEKSWEWKEKYGGIILQQLKKLGASCDWDRTSFTMDDHYYKAVIKVFIDLYKKGYIYRGLRMINWDSEAKTALSNEEVIYNENGENATLYFVKYKILDSNEFVTIATVRPETIMGDTAIAVNPNDKRFKHLIGKKAIVPFVNREIPIIGDDYVDVEFGTGCLKITPAHDTNDNELGQKHNLEIINILNEDGTLNEDCGVIEWVGVDRFKARKLVVKKLEELKILTDKKDFITKIGRSERTNTVVEPRLSLQWFIKMKDISKTAQKVVAEDEIKLFPSKFKNTYNHWMENVRDWCISRQLWWGQRIPAYYYGEGEEEFVVANSFDEALEMVREIKGADFPADKLNQDSDVLDTWASSWLWPIQVFGGLDDVSFNPETGTIDMSKASDLSYFYPTKVLVTAPEILFFWVARMIIAGYEYTGQKPFEDVYLTGIVRDKQGRKMSKSLGNSPDPLDLIKEYGADGVRTGMLFSSPAGNDLLFDVKLCEQGRNFANKIWNAYRLVDSWEIKEGNTPHLNSINWFEARFNAVLSEIEDHFSKYRISDALLSIYKLIWNDFCAWYLEIIKPSFGEPIDSETLKFTIDFFEKLLKVLHPFMPFLTEEIYQKITKRGENDSIMISKWPKKSNFDTKIIQDADIAFEIVSQTRNIRNSNGISPKESLKLIVVSAHPNNYKSMFDVIEKLGNVAVSFENKLPSSPSFILKGDEFLIPVETVIDAEEEKKKLLGELEYIRGFKNSITKKLTNERFVNNAPEQVVQNEKNKLIDAEAKISIIEENLKKL